MKNIIFCLFFIPFVSYGELVTIEIDYEVFNHVDQSFLLISDYSGEMITSKKLDDFSFEKNYMFSFDCLDSVSNYSFTVYNEYISESGVCFFKAITYQDIYSGMIIKDDFCIVCNKIEEDIEGYIDISGITELHDIQSNSIDFDLKKTYKIRAGKIRIKYSVQPGKDLFLALKCNKEEYRYLFVKENQLEGIIKVNWQDLNQDLIKTNIVTKEVDLNYKILKGVNEETQVPCLFFSLNNQDYMRDSIQIISPQFPFFKNYELLFSIYSEKFIESKSYFLRTDTLPNEIIIPSFDELNVDYHFGYIDTTGFQILNEGEAINFRVEYQFDQWSIIKSIDKVSNIYSSTWKVFGKSIDYRTFTFPNIDHSSEFIFLSMKNIKELKPNLIQISKPLEPFGEIQILNTLQGL